MRKLNYEGSSKVILRIVERINYLLDLGSGHTIIDNSGNNMTARAGLQFKGATVYDDSTDDKTVVQIPTALSAFTNDAGFITSTVNNLTNYYLKSETYTQAEVNALIGAIVTLNILVVQTLPTQDISTTTIYLVPKQTAGTNDVYDEYMYINNAWELIGTTQIDLSNYYTKSQTDSLLADKVDKVAGKQLSTEDFTSTLKTKLDGIASGAEVNVQSDWSQSDNTADDYIKNKPTNVSDFNNDSGFITGVDVEDIGDVDLTNLANGQVLKYNSTTQKWENANESGGGATYTEGDGIDISAQNVISVDTTFSEASTRANIASGDTFATILGKIKKFFTDLKTVAFSGSYSDLSDKPTIPTVNNGTLTIQKNGTDVQTFTANQSSNVTANISVPTKTSQLTNDSGFITDISGKANAKPSASGNMNQAASYGNALGMINLSGTNTNINPNGQTGWHHFINMSYNTESNNMWQTQFAIKAGTTDVWVRSRAGGSIVDGTAWAANWVKLIHSGNIGSQSVNYATSAGSATDSTKVAKAGDTMTGVLKSSYRSSSWVNSLNNSVITVTDDANSYGGWICGPTKNGRIAIASYSASDDKLYIGYGEKGRTTNSFTRSIAWNGATGKLEASITGNCDGNAATASDSSKLNGYASDTSATANTIVRRQANGYIYAVYYNASNSAENINSYTAYVMFKDNNGWQRCTSKANFQTWLGLGEAAYINARNGAEANTACKRDSAGSIGVTNLFASNSSNWLGILATATACKNFANTAYAPIYASSYPGTSSRRYKENIKPITEEIAEKILDVEVVTFDYKEDSGATEEYDRFNRRGVIAEDVVNITPEVVFYKEIDGENVPDSVDYQRFIPYLIKMVQIQQAEINDLKAEISALKK